MRATARLCTNGCGSVRCPTDIETDKETAGLSNSVDSSATALAHPGFLMEGFAWAYPAIFERGTKPEGRGRLELGSSNNSDVERGVRGADRTGLQTGENCISKKSRKNSDSKYVFACNKNKALQPARTCRRHGRLLITLGLIETYAAPQFPKPKTKGRQI